VRLFRAARAERVSLRRLYRAEAPSRSMLASREPEEDDRREEPVAESSKNRRATSTESKATALEAPEPVLAPVQQASVRKGSDQIIAEKSVVKGYEYDKDRYVAIEPEELK